MVQEQTLQLITHDLIDETAGRAARSPRRRMNHNFHASAADNPHRFLNVFLKGTYVQPHRHLNPPKAESFLVLEGRAAVLVFDGDGAVTARHEIGCGTCPAFGIDLAPGVWHTIVALTDRVVCFEVKPGPWDPATDKDFASWAPREGEADAAAYLDRLLAATV